jgi:hypothetical protein
MVAFVYKSAERLSHFVDTKIEQMIQQREPGYEQCDFELNISLTF